ncbi:hypothetical protein PCE1_000202 [Barthelona sp. PCE]
MADRLLPVGESGMTANMFVDISTGTEKDEDLSNSKVLSFDDKAPNPPKSHLNRNRVLFTQNTTKSAVQRRVVPSQAERILSASGMTNDFYTNVLDWSSRNVVAVGVKDSVFLWNGNEGSVSLLLNLSGSNTVTSVRWMDSGTHIAIGTSSGDVQLWDPVKGKQLRSLKGHGSRVGAAAWNSHILSSGSQDGIIMNSDVRVKQHIVSHYQEHEQEICSLSYNSDGTQLASGGNDNFIKVWDVRDNDSLYTFNDHFASVKALTYSPKQTNILASGAGAADRTIKVWDTKSGALINSVQTESQVCSVLWSTNSKEIVTTHGHSSNSVCLWSWPKFKKVAEIRGHTDRVLHSTLSPDGETVCTAGDQTIRFWRLFNSTPSLNLLKQQLNHSRKMQKQGLNVR